MTPAQQLLRSNLYDVVEDAVAVVAEFYDGEHWHLGTTTEDFPPAVAGAIERVVVATEVGFRGGIFTREFTHYDAAERILRLITKRSLA